MAVLVSFAAGGAALGYGGHLAVTLVVTILLVAGHALSWRWRLRRRHPLEVLTGCLAVAAATIYFGYGWVAPSPYSLTPPELVLIAAAISAPFTYTRRSLYLTFGFSLLLVYWSGWHDFGPQSAVAPAAWLGCAVAFRYLVLLEDTRVAIRWPEARPLAFLFSCFLVGSIAFLLVPQLITPSPGPVFVRPPLSIPITASSKLATLAVDQPQPAGTGVVLEAHTPAFAYWRGDVYDTLSGGVWLRSSSKTVEGDTITWLAGSDGTKGSYTSVFVSAASLGPAIYLPYPVEQLYSPIDPVRIDAYHEVLLPSQIDPGQEWSATSLIPEWTAGALGASTGAPDIKNAASRSTAGLPSGAKSLALSAAAGATTRYQKVIAVTDWLKTRHGYDRAIVPDPDPMFDLLFGSLRGNSLGFASTEILMLRSLGVPSRLATGYLASDWSPQLGEAVARAYDWHAWVEVYFPGQGWVPIDPTPGTEDVPAPRLMGHVSVQWVGGLVPSLAAMFHTTQPPSLPVAQPAPTPEAQPTFPAQAPTAPTPPIAQVIAGLNIPISTTVLQEIGSAAAAGLLAVMAIAVAVRFLMAQRAGRSSTALLALYVKAQRRQRRRRRESETPLEYLNAMSASSSAPVLRQATDLVHREQYAGVEIDAAQQMELAASIRGYGGSSTSPDRRSSS